MNSKRFSLLDINPNGDSPKYFILAANNYGDTRFYGADSTAQYYTKPGAHFNADDKESVANALNYEHIGKENPNGNNYLQASTLQTLDKKIVSYVHLNKGWNPKKNNKNLDKLLKDKTNNKKKNINKEYTIYIFLLIGIIIGIII